MDNRFIIKSIGADNTSYIYYSIASILWVVGFLYVNENSVSSQSSNISRGVALMLLNIIPLYLPRKDYSSYEKP